MDALADRLSRVSALRPRLHTGPNKPAASSKSDQLARQLNAEIRSNRLGSHLLVRRLYPHLGRAVVHARAARLIEPDREELVCDTGQWLFLDTETTGLAGGTGTYAFLVGVAWWEQDDFVLEQYFMRDHGEEPSLLLGLLEPLSQRSVMITFNGKCFDWPLLQTRYQMTRAGTLRAPLAHLDLLYPSRQLWQLSLQSVALARLEQHVLRLDRGQDILSETIPQRYFDFLRGDAPEGMAEVFRHNQLDLCGLASLAVHVFGILADPENRNCTSEELFGVSRLLQRRGESHLAGRTYKKALEGGLPRTAEQIAQRELALLAKRGCNFELSNDLWKKLLGDTAEGIRAYEQLAIYYERNARLPEMAVPLVREALVKLQEAFRNGRISPPKYVQWHAAFQHRLARLTAKTSARKTPLA
jgi:uncharacterized protein